MFARFLAILFINFFYLTPSFCSEDELSFLTPEKVQKIQGFLKKEAHEKALKFGIQDVEQEQTEDFLSYLDQMNEETKNYYNQDFNKGILKFFNDILTAGGSPKENTRLDEIFTPNGINYLESVRDEAFELMKRRRKKSFAKGNLFLDTFKIDLEVEPLVPPQAHFQTWTLEFFQLNLNQIHRIARRNELQSRHDQKIRMNHVQELQEKIKTSAGAFSLIQTLDEVKTLAILQGESTAISEDTETNAIDVNMQEFLDNQLMIELGSPISNCENKGKKKSSKKKKRKKKNVKANRRKDQKECVNREALKESCENIDQRAPRKDSDSSEDLATLNLSQQSPATLHPRITRWRIPFNPNKIRNFHDGIQHKYDSLNKGQLLEQWMMHQGGYFFKLFGDDFRHEVAQKYFVELKDHHKRISYVAKAVLVNEEHGQHNSRAKQGFLVLAKGADGSTWIHAKFDEFEPQGIDDIVRGFFPMTIKDMPIHEEEELDDVFLPVHYSFEFNDGESITLKFENGSITIFPKIEL